MEIQVVYYNAILNSFIIIETDSGSQVAFYLKNMHLDWVVCLGIL